MTFAVKRPVRELEAKPWPEYDAETMLKDEYNEKPRYYSRVKINGKEVVCSKSYEEVVEPSEEDLNPVVYIRLTNSLRDD